MASGIGGIPADWARSMTDPQAFRREQDRLSHTSGRSSGSPATSPATATGSAPRSRPARCSCSASATSSGVSKTAAPTAATPCAMPTRATGRSSAAFITGATTRRDARSASPCARSSTAAFRASSTRGSIRSRSRLAVPWCSAAFPQPAARLRASQPREPRGLPRHRLSDPCGDVPDAGRADLHFEPRQGELEALPPHHLRRLSRARRPSRHVRQARLSPALQHHL